MRRAIGLPLKSDLCSIEAKASQLRNLPWKHQAPPLQNAHLATGFELSLLSPPSISMSTSVSVWKKPELVVSLPLVLPAIFICAKA
jgi:hypothetical protein